MTPSSNTSEQYFVSHNSPAELQAQAGIRVRSRVGKQTGLTKVMMVIAKFGAACRDSESYFMREIIPRRVWVGNARDGENVAEVISREIMAVVHLAMEEPPCQFPREIIYCRFPLLDGTGNSPAILRTIVQTVGEIISADMPILITCSGGMSRSPCVAAAAVAFAKNESPDEWLKLVTVTGPHDIAPALWYEIRSFAHRNLMPLEKT